MYTGELGCQSPCSLWGPYAKQLDAALGNMTKMSILIMQFSKHKIYRGGYFTIISVSECIQVVLDTYIYAIFFTSFIGKPTLSNLYNCTRFFINEDIPEIINFKKK